MYIYGLWHSTIIQGSVDCWSTGLKEATTYTNINKTQMCENYSCYFHHSYKVLRWQLTSYEKHVKDKANCIISACFIQQGTILQKCIIVSVIVKFTWKPLVISDSIYSKCLFKSLKNCSMCLFSSFLSFPSVLLILCDLLHCTQCKHLLPWDSVLAKNYMHVERKFIKWQNILADDYCTQTALCDMNIAHTGIALKIYSQNMVQF